MIRALRLISEQVLQATYSVLLVMLLFTVAISMMLLMEWPLQRMDHYKVEPSEQVQELGFKGGGPPLLLGLINWEDHEDPELGYSQRVYGPHPRL